MRSVPKSKPSNDSSSSFFSFLRQNNPNNPPLLFVSLVTSAFLPRCSAAMIVRRLVAEAVVYQEVVEGRVVAEEAVDHDVLQ